MNTTATATAGYFTLDSWYDDKTGKYAAAFPAVRFGERWNGWQTPVVTRSTMQAFVAKMESERLDGPLDGYDMFKWDGDDVLLKFYDNDNEEPYRFSPDSDGLYDLGLIGYTFCLCERDGALSVTD